MYVVGTHLKCFTKVLLLNTYNIYDLLGPVVRGIISLTSSFVVKTLTVLINTISNSKVFLLKKCEKLCKCKSYPQFFSKNMSLYAIFKDQSFNDMLTNDTVSFEQQGPVEIRKIFTWILHLSGAIIYQPEAKKVLVKIHRRCHNHYQNSRGNAT